MGFYLQVLPILFFLNKFSKATISPTSSDSTTESYISSASSESFGTDTISCSAIETCVIVCDEAYGCMETTVDASLASNLILNCTQIDSCNSMVITNGPTLNADINCNGITSCAYADFNIPTTNIINLECDNLDCPFINSNDDCTSYPGSCKYLNLNAESTTDINIQCGGDNYDCDDAVFNVNNANSAIFAIGMRSCYGCTIYGNYITSLLSITCASGSGCGATNIYCPSSALSSECNINCYGSWACTQSNIYIDADSNSNNSTDFSINCGTDKTRCYGLSFQCKDTESSTNYVYSEYDNSYVCQSSDCCPDDFSLMDDVIDCEAISGANNPCTIDCIDYGGCDVQIVDASKASSLTLQCQSENGDCEVNCGDLFLTRGCENALIIPPIEGDATINCNEEAACKYIQIDNNGIEQTSSLILNCIDKESCQYMSINELIISDSAEIACSGSSGYDDGCTHSDISLMIDASAIITIDVSSDGSMEDSKIYIEGLSTSSETQVTFNTASGSYGGLVAAKIDLINIDSVTIDCQEGCTESIWNIQANDVTFDAGSYSAFRDCSINGTIGNTLIIESNGMDGAFSDTNLTVTCNEGDECLNILNCADQDISIYCGDISAVDTSDDECTLCECVADTNERVFIPFPESTRIWGQCELETPSPTGSNGSDDAEIPNCRLFYFTSIALILRALCL